MLIGPLGPRLQHLHMFVRIKRIRGSSGRWWRVIIGMALALGGPIGAIVGGFLATAAMGQTLMSIDEHKKKMAIEATTKAERVLFLSRLSFSSKITYYI